VKKLNSIFIVLITSSTLFIGLQPAHAVNYTITYNANESQHQAGVTAGSVPSPTSYAAGTVVTVSANTGSLARQGFTFAGWNTLANGSGTTYTPGSGTLTLNSDITLYAKWTIPASARLIGAGGSLVTITDPNSVFGASNCTGGNIRGITSDGTYVYFRPSKATTYLCKVDLNGYVVQAINVGASLSAISIDSIDLSYSSGCIFLRPNGSANNNINCIDTSDWTLNAKTVSQNWYTGGGWLTGNIIDFPDGRVGAVSAPNTAAPNGVGTGAGQCPSGMYCKILRLFNVVGTGKDATFTFSEDIVLADNESGWPDDEHGIATDGTYLYEIRFNSGYKVWALRSGAPSYIVFNGSGSGACTATTGVSGSLCPINTPTAGVDTTTNATFLGRNHIAGTYLMGDYEGKKFYKSESSFPPAGPGSLIASFNSVSLPSNATTASYRTPVVISVSVSVASKVTFKAANVIINGCKNKVATGSGSIFTATCSWKPSVRGAVPITVSATPTGPGYGATVSNPLNIFVGKRTGSR
jgi:uncharacterized repeat protein (TIGR02543 family)